MVQDIIHVMLPFIEQVQNVVQDVEGHILRHGIIQYDEIVGSDGFLRNPFGAVNTDDDGMIHPVQTLRKMDGFYQYNVFIHPEEIVEEHRGMDRIIHPRIHIIHLKIAIHLMKEKRSVQTHRIPLLYGIVHIVP